MSSKRKPAVPFSSKDDSFLVKYLAYYKPDHRGRMGNKVYEVLTDDIEHKWPWSQRHPWQSWRERYKKNHEEFDYKIRQYQKKKGILPGDPPPELSQAQPTSSKAKGKRRVIPDDDESMDETPEPIKTKRKRVSETADKERDTKKAKVKAVEERNSPRAVISRKQDEEELELASPPSSSNYSNEIFGKKSSETEDDEEMVDGQLMEEAEQSLEDDRPSSPPEQHSEDPPTPGPSRIKQGPVQESPSYRAPDESRCTPPTSSMVTTSSRVSRVKFSQSFNYPRRNDAAFFTPSPGPGLPSVSDEEDPDGGIAARRRRRHQPLAAAEGAIRESTTIRHSEDRDNTPQPSVPQQSPLPSRLERLSASPRLRHASRLTHQNGSKSMDMAVDLQSSHARRFSLSPRPSSLPPSPHRASHEPSETPEELIEQIKRELRGLRPTNRTHDRQSSVHHAFSQETQQVPLPIRSTPPLDGPGSKASVGTIRTLVNDRIPPNPESSRGQFGREGTPLSRSRTSVPPQVSTPHSRDFDPFAAATPPPIRPIANQPSALQTPRTPRNLPEQRTRQELRNMLLKTRRVADANSNEGESSRSGSRSSRGSSQEAEILVTRATTTPPPEITSAWLAHQDRRTELKQEPQDPVISHSPDRRKSSPRIRFDDTGAKAEARSAIPPQAVPEPNSPQESPILNSPRHAPSPHSPLRTASPLAAHNSIRASPLGHHERHDSMGDDNSFTERSGQTPRIDLSARPKRLTRPSAPALRESSSSTAVHSMLRRSDSDFGSVRSRPRPSSASASRRASLLPSLSAVETRVTPIAVDFPISETDHEYIMHHGIRLIIDKLSAVHGFQQSVAWNVYNYTKDLLKTEKVLKKMRKSADKTGVNAIQRFSEQVDDDDDESYEGEEEVDEEGEETQDQPMAGVPNRRSIGDASAPRRSLNWKPAKDDVGFSPDKSTRAAEFVRLESQRRREEALLREARRASYATSRV